MINDYILQSRKICKSYRQDGVVTDVLHGIDFAIKRGEFCSIMGPSGCGKSTLLHILGLMLTANSADELAIDGVNTLGLNQSQRTRIRRDKIGFVFQRFNLIDVLTAEDNLKLALKLKGKSSTNHVLELLELVGISDKARHKPHQMSIGEQQRLAIARAVIHQPAILLADEPTGNLDSGNAERVMDLLRYYHKQFNQTIIMVTHNPDLARQADRLICMKDGRIVA